mgnify:CR=1 FL=1
MNDNLNLQLLNEIKNLILIKKQNNIILEKLKQTNYLYHKTIDSLLNESTEKEKEIQKINNMFLENKKHLKYILGNLKS